MSPRPKVNSTHGGRGPQPQSFERWVASASKRGVKRFRVTLGDGATKLVAHKSAPDSTRRIVAMSPSRVEGLDDKDAELGEWTFPDVEGEEEPEPGYLKDEDDTETERVLKTFAHLLADAHRLSARQLVEVVGIQSKNFAEERRSLLQLQLVSERVLTKRLRGLPARLRVADGEEPGEGEEIDEGRADDTFLQDLLQPMLEKMAAKMGGRLMGDANGAPTKEEKGS